MTDSALWQNYLLFSVAISAALASASKINAEIVKQASVDCGKGEICLYWWPKLPSIKGWHTDPAANTARGGNGINSRVPDGFTFANADVVIYGAATYRARYEWENPASKSLGAFITDDRESFSSKHPMMRITEAAPLITADGQKLRSMIYISPSENTWEQVAYGLEDDYYLVFTISARSRAAFEGNLPAYHDLIMHYRK